MFDATRIGIHWRLFRNDLISKNVTKLSLVKSLFNQNTGKKGPRILPNSVIDLFMRVLWNSSSKTLQIIQKNISSGALFYKNYTTDTFLVVITKEKMLKKNSLYSCPFLANVKGLLSRNSDFNKNRLQEKCFLRAFWNISETSLEEVYSEVILLKKQDYFLETSRF